MAKLSNEKRIEALEQKMDMILDILQNGNAPKATKGSGKATKAKDNYEVVATSKENRQKVYDAMKKDGKEYDRNTYKKYAKKLGVWSDKFNKVVGTYK